MRIVYIPLDATRMAHILFYVLVFRDKSAIFLSALQHFEAGPS
jgi:hypothetical protein